MPAKTDIKSKSKTIAPRVQDDILTSSEVADMLGKTPGALRNCIMRGQFPRGVKVPGMKGLRWRRSTVDTWMTKAFK